MLIFTYEPPSLLEKRFAKSNTKIAIIALEDNVLIGACSLVNTNVAANSVMLGVPAVKVSEKSSEGYV